LERLAQSYPEHRQTIVDLICGYLRLRKEVSNSDAQAAQVSLVDLRDPLWIPGREEADVRATAQRILKRHLDTRAGESFWRFMWIDLRGAKLEDFSLEVFDVFRADFRDAEFWGHTEFALGRFGIGAHANFDQALFRGTTNFAGTTFDGTLLLLEHNSWMA
jgi:uncharacterized protein YjbI with pentapeptide repeats